MFVWLHIHRRKMTALLLLVLPLIFLVSSARATVGVETSAPGRLAGGIWGAGQAAAHSIIGNLGGLARFWGDKEAMQEVEELRAEVKRLREEKTRLIGVLQENARLRELVGFQSRRPDLELVPAQVIARDLSPYFRVLKIRIRTDEEIKPRMPVVSAEGVVGQVHRVYKGYADVVLVSDPRSRIDAISQRNRALGIVEGLGHEADYLARVAYLRAHDQVRVGDELVTSGMGGIFPRELTIGRIVSVRDDENGLFQEVLIEPAVDMSRLDEVFIITNVDGPSL